MGFVVFVPSVKRPVNFTGVQFACHCNHVDVIPVFGMDPGECCTWGFCGFMLD